jgi:hypothetical protein
MVLQIGRFRVRPAVDDLTRSRRLVLAHGLESIALGAQLTENGPQGLHGLRSVSTSIVRQHDGSQVSFAQHLASDSLGSGTLPVLRVDVPQENCVSQLCRPRPGVAVCGIVGRAQAA